MARARSGDPYYCHCRMCQKAFGHLSGVFCGVERRSVVWERAEPAYYRSSKVARRGFCRECGTPLTFEYLGSEDLHLAVGSLDEPGRFRPVAHYGSESIVEPFFTDDGLPRERTEDDEEFVARRRAPTRRARKRSSRLQKSWRTVDLTTVPHGRSAGR